MIRKYLLQKAILSLFLLFTFTTAIIAQKVSITTNPQSARIYVNGVKMGAGSLVVTIPSNQCVTVQVADDGFLSEERTYCKKRGVTPPPKNDYIQLDADESYTSSVQSNFANIDITLDVKKDRTKTEAWKIIIATILGKFDVLEMNDEKSGYLRTNWIGVTYKRNTLRMRVIVKQTNEDPMQYKMKFITEISNRSGTPFTADEQFQPFDRILKKYDGFLDEMQTKLKN
jgi:hypothetical protein